MSSGRRVPARPPPPSGGSAQSCCWKLVVAEDADDGVDRSGVALEVLRGRTLVTAWTRRGADVRSLVLGGGIVGDEVVVGGAVAGEGGTKL